MISELAKQIHRNAIDKGFYENPLTIGERIALIHSEASEALEADRKGSYYKGKFEHDKEYLNYLKLLKEDKLFKELFLENVKDTFEDELADIIIRVLDLAAFEGIDIEAHVKLKMRYNSLREYKHGKKY